MLDDALSEAGELLGLADAAPLTAGGQKAVYEAIRDGEAVVLKVVALEPPYQEHVLERARREVELLASLDSPHVVRVLSPLTLLPSARGENEPAEAACWLEERLDGVDLTDLLGAPWDRGGVLSMLRDVATGLGALHERDVVHRDLSPGNIRRLESGTWKVMDPGLARHLAEITITGLVQPGTYGYRTPEHVPGGLGPTPASDMFGLGILAYQMLSGVFPVEPSPDDDEYYRRLLEGRAPSIGTHRADLDPGWIELIDRMLHPQPARRPLDAHELLADMAVLEDDA